MKRQNAFTLVEIIIVITIIGLLAAIIVPNFMKAREKSVENKARNEAGFEYSKVYQATLMVLTNPALTNTLNKELERKAVVAAETASNTVYLATLGAVYPNLTNVVAPKK